MKTRLIKRLVGLACTIAGVMAQVVVASECFKVDCDCASIEHVGLKANCINQELVLNEACASRGKIKGYCSMHGPSANRIAITSILKPKDFMSSDLNGDTRKIASIYWSLGQDVDFSRRSFMQGDLKTAFSIMKISGRNIGSLYGTQQAVTNLLESQNKARKAISAWKNFAPDTNRLAGVFQKYAFNIIEKSEALAKEGKVKSDLYIKAADITLGLAGRLYEQAGIAYGNAKKHKNAAKAWKQASKVSIERLKFKFNAGNSIELREVAAARLNRASFHWLKRSGVADAEALQRKAEGILAEHLLNTEILK